MRTLRVALVSILLALPLRAQAADWTQVGMASWYGHESGKRTASGRRFEPQSLTCAHRSLPLFTRIRVTVIGTGRSVVCTVLDRGPYRHHRIVDCAELIAQLLGFHRAGVALVRLEEVR